jgi:hypothetical protein
MPFLRFHSIGIALALLFASGNALAQFSQPPPRTPAPTCSYPKSFGGNPPEGSDCRVKLAIRPAYAYTILECGHYNGSVNCYSSTDLYENGQWTTLDPSTLTHYWAYRVDGQEYYLPPFFSNSLSIDCGHTRQVYVRVTAGDSTAESEIRCPLPVPNEW